ncbi:ATP-grasp domain-containing protein [Candidatus Kaiserbacteria bacterium]|nr:ATP-grasp domain-containing protein [Candidatus Kaiserbacteria bacterium]
MKKNRKNIIVYVMSLPAGVIESVRKFSKENKTEYKVMLLWDSRVEDAKDRHKNPDLDLYVSCDFSKPDKVIEALAPYRDNLLAITCRSESSMARFAEIIPHVPYLRTPTSESLITVSDKYEMRKRMRAYNPKITPKYSLVKSNSEEERGRIAEKVGFPMIIKPTNMAASLFVSICYHEEDLEKTLGFTFRSLKKAYAADNRIESPKVIAEEYMDGDLYSLDSYVDSRGTIYHCPLVKQITAKKIGHDDFYNHIQMTPTGLKSSTVENARKAAEDAIHAVGLRSSIAHTELMKLDDEWKIVEIGGRMGGFRHLLHELSCDIDHTLNDIFIRIPKKPVIPKKCKGYACALKWFAEKEGVITEMKGIKKIEQLESFNSINVKKKVGDKAIFARNGGRSVFDLFLYNAERSKLLADIRRAEQLVNIKVAGRKKAVATEKKLK